GLVPRRRPDRGHGGARRRRLLRRIRRDLGLRLLDGRVRRAGLRRPLSRRDDSRLRAAIDARPRARALRDALPPCPPPPPPDRPPCPPRRGGRRGGPGLPRPPSPPSPGCRPRPAGFP